MPRAILHFKLPGESCEYRIASHAMDWALAMLDLDNELREIVKYRSDDYGADELTAYDAVRDMLRKHLSGNGVSLEDIE